MMNLNELEGEVYVVFLKGFKDESEWI